MNDFSPPTSAMPVNYEAEVQLLGAILANNRAYDLVGEFLTQEMFADERHAKIFDACAKLINCGRIASHVTLKNYFEQDASLDQLGGVDYLARLAASAVTVINAGDHGRLIRETYIRRQQIYLGQELADAASRPDIETDAEVLGSEFAERLDALNAGTSDSGPALISKSVRDAITRAKAAKKGGGGITGVATGLIDVDRKLGGLHEPDLIVVAGATGMGKTAFASSAALYAARNYIEGRDEAGRKKVVSGAIVGFFTLEMSAEELTGRMLAELSGVSYDKQRRGAFDTEEEQRLNEAGEALDRIPLFVDETAGLSISRLQQRCRRLHRTKGLGLIVVDYLQLIESELKSKGDRNRVQEVTAVSRGLKKLAKDLKVPVLALAQLSRELEKRDDKRPHLSDLRESGSIEQDANVVCFLYRHEYYLARQKPVRGPRQKQEQYDADMALWAKELDDCRGVAELIIAKNRNGPSNVTVKLKFDAARTAFDNLAEGSST